MKIKIHPMDELLSFWVYRMQTQSSTVLRRAFEAAGYILTGEQWGVLTRLKEDEGINQSQLGEKMLKDRHNVTRILNLLEKRGYIKRRADSADMRAYRIFLTQEGRAVQESLNSIVENHLKNMYGGLSPEDLAAMRRIVERVVTNLEKRPLTETIRHRTGKEPMQTTEGWKQRTSGGRLSRFILAGFIFLFPAGCGKTQQQAAPAPPAVEVAGVIQKDVPVYAEWIASTDGLVNATIRAQVQGYLVARSYKEGDFVRKGQILFEIDPRPSEAAVEQAGGAWHQAQAVHSRANAALEQVRAEVAQAEARYTPAKSYLDRVRPLAAQHALSQKDLDDAIGSEKMADAAVRAAQAAVAAAQASLEASQAAVLASKAALEKARLDLGFTKILSPIDGIAGIAKAQIGNLVGPGSIEELTTVSTVNPIRVYIPVSEQEYMQSNGNGRNTSRQATFELILADGRIHPHKGSFSFTDRQVDTRTGTIKIATIFPNPGNLLRPGQFARVRAASRVKKGALLVPQRAVIEIQGTYQVAVVGADNKVDIRPVKVAERIGTLWVIDEGLKPGEQVVAEGVQKVRQGMVVTPKPFAPTTGPAPNTPSPPVPASAAKSLSAGQETERR